MGIVKVTEVTEGVLDATAGADGTEGVNALAPERVSHNKPTHLTPSPGCWAPRRAGGAREG